MSVLVCENLTKVYKSRPSIRNFSYNFLDSQIYALVGKSDSGLEVLLNLLATKIRPDRGSVWLDGETLYNNHRMSQRICYISKNASFPGHVRISAVCRLMAVFYPKWDNGYAHELFRQFNIDPKVRYGRLALHEKELVVGILGLASRANITVFDNPLRHVDMKDRYDFFNTMYQHHTRYPRMLIIATDYLDEIETIANRLLFFDKGRLFENFSVDEVRNGFRFLSGKAEVLKSLIAGMKIIGVEERENNLTVCIGKKLTKDEIRKYQKYLIKISEVPIQKVFIYLVHLREKKGI